MPTIRGDDSAIYLGGLVDDVINERIVF